MRNVVNSREVCHLWAHKAQSGARNGKGSIFFDGDTIYSYGRHFAIARHVVNDKGESAILFTNREYSNTTSKHKSYVRRAIPDGVKVFYVESVNRLPTAADVAEKEQMAVKSIAASKRARLYKSGHIAQAESYLAAARAMNEFWDINTRVSTLEQLGVEADALNKAKREDAENKRKAEEAAIKAAQERIEAWKAGYVDTLPYLVLSYGRIENSDIVTSKGAKVPISHVAKIAPLVRKYIAEGRTYKRNGHTIHLGHYQLDEITSDGMVIAGCHKFSKEETLRILDLVEKFCLDVSTVGVFPTGV